MAKIDEFPELKDTLAELLADGVPMQKIADQMGVRDRGTVAEWKKREEIQQRVSKLIRDRANRILSKIDSKVAGKLDSDKDIPLETLLRARQTFAGEILNINPGATEDEVLAELMKRMHSNPELAAAFGAIAPNDD